MSNTEATDHRSAFLLTPGRFGAIIQMIASYKRTSMHHIMKKSDKVAQHEKDLDYVHEHQAFVYAAGEGVMKSSSLIKYEAVVHSLAQKLGEESRKNVQADLTKCIDLKKLPFPAYTYAHLDNLNGILKEWVANLLIIDAEVRRKPVNRGDMIHEELKADDAEAKEAKAVKGRAVLQDSTAGVKRPRARKDTLKVN